MMSSSVDRARATIRPQELTITGTTLEDKTYDGNENATVKGITFDGLVNGEIMSLNSIMMVNFNAVLNQFSTTAVAVFGACCRTTSFFYALLNAMCSATIPIIAYNHGAKNKTRIDQAIRFGYLYSGILMAIGTMLCVGFPEVFLQLFNATDEMIEIGVWGMQMLCCCYVLCAVWNMSGCILQALGHSVVSRINAAHTYTPKGKKIDMGNYTFKIRAKRWCKYLINCLREKTGGLDFSMVYVGDLQRNTNEYHGYSMTDADDLKRMLLAVPIEPGKLGHSDSDF